MSAATHTSSPSVAALLFLPRNPSRVVEFLRVVRYVTHRQIKVVCAKGGAAFIEKSGSVAFIEKSGSAAFIEKSGSAAFIEKSGWCDLRSDW